MTTLPLSVFIITQDEADRVAKPILSTISWVDEVIVIDSGSKDNTVEIAEKLGARTVFNQWNGYGRQKIYGEGLCRNNWLLNIDADEEISPKLRDEIIALFADGEPEYKAYQLIISTLGRFDDKAPAFAPYHDPIRLYDKNYAGFKDSTVHDSVVLKDPSQKAEKLKNIVLHRSLRSYSHAVEKINRYSSMQAEDMFRRGKKPSALRILFEPLIGFTKGYFIRKYCFLGFDGFIEAVVYAFARTLRLAKTRELWKEKEYKERKKS